jgi:hypothetical protein
MSEEVNGEPIEDPVAFFASLGYLRGAGIDGISLQVLDQVLILYVDDLHAAQEGLPGYPGARACALAFLGAGKVGLDIDIEDGLRIASLRAIESAEDMALYTLEVELDIGGRPGGKGFALSFTGLDIVDMESADED